MDFLNEGKKQNKRLPFKGYYLKNFKDYIFDSTYIYDKKIIRISDLDKSVPWYTSKLDKKENVDSYNERLYYLQASRVIKKLYIDIILNGLYFKEAYNNTMYFNNNLPILNLTGNSNRIKKFIKKFNIPIKNVYNKPEDAKISSDKVLFYKTFADNFWMKKVVYSYDDIFKEKLQFPIVGKPSSGLGGKGIKFFKSKEDLEKENIEDFDLFMEYIDIKHEFRLLLFKKKIWYFYERVKRGDYDFTKKEKDEKTSFIYVPQKIGDHIPSDVFEMVDEICEKVKLDMFAIDFAIDKNDKVFVIEINSAPGFGIENVLLYKLIYEDFYKELFDEEYFNLLLEKYYYKGLLHAKKAYKYYFNKSLWPLV